jgi:hypothetical protein
MDGATAYHQPQPPSFNLALGLNSISISKRQEKEEEVGKYDIPDRITLKRLRPTVYLNKLI